MESNDIQDLVRQKVENLCPKLLDLSRRNPLVATKLSPRSNAHIRVVDELPDVLFYTLGIGQAMRLVPLPEIDEDPKDEERKTFRDALANARITDQAYLTELEGVERDAEDYLDRTRAIERALKDRIRAELGMPERPTKAAVNLVQHARNNGIIPSYELPDADSEHEDGRHTDNDIQTLLLPKDLERKLNNVTSKCRTWIQETGINVLHVAYGFLEWSEPNQTETSFAPLILSAARIERNRTPQGVEFWISGTGEEPEINAVLSEKLRIEFGVELPEYDGASVEAYLQLVAELAPKQIVWRVRRQVAIGVFPSARMAMYHDLDPADPTFPDSEILRSLLAGTNTEVSAPFADEYNVDEPEIEASVPCIVMDADSSQFSTLVDIAKGKNLAVEGPPGTGKSQTIVNAIAAALADGKKVLFVAEKLAALNVVRSRLEAIRLGEFLLPLQAERSTREQVIASVRSRIEMGSPRPVREYESQLAEYRRVRSEIADYIDLLTLPFSDSGLTIHAILGRSIATSPHLAAIPSEVLDDCVVPLEFLNTRGLARLRDAAVVVEKAYAAVARASENWKSTQLLYAERFTVEEACHLAYRASKAYYALSDARGGLASFRIGTQLNANELTELAEILEQLQMLPAMVPADLLLALLQDKYAEHIGAFLERCDSCQSTTVALVEVVTGPIDETTLEQVEEAAAICSRSEFDTLDVAQLENILGERQEALDAAYTMAQGIKPLVEVRLEAADWNLSDLTKAQQAVAEAGRDALLCRNSFTADPAAVPLLTKLCHEGRELKAAKTQLEQKVSLAIEAPVEVLVSSIATIWAAGLFSFLSRDYRRAKRLARSLSLTGRFSKPESLGALGELLAFRKKEREFLRNPQVTTLFGVHFRGVDTDFEPFERLARFYDTVYATFRAPQKRPLRKFLWEGDVEELELIPAVAADIPVDSYQVLQSNIALAEEEIKQLECGIASLRPCLAAFRNPASVAPNTLESLVGQIKEVLRLRKTLNSDDEIARLIGQHFEGWQSDTDDLQVACHWALAALPWAKEVEKVLELGSVPAASEQIRRVLETSAHAAQVLGALSEVSKIGPIHFTAGRTDEAIAEALEQASRDSDGLFVHSALADAMHNLRPTGATPLMQHRLDVDRNLDHFADQVEALAVRRLAKAAYAEHGRKLAMFSGKRLDQLRAALAEHDRQIIRLSRQQLRCKIHASARPPYGNGVGKKSTWTQMALIENEVSKRQKFVSVRDLTQRAGRALLELKPCWMMSPLAVAQYVPKGALNFDLCIIDEASQMPPESAIGALLRCMQTVVVGDTNQLPPSTFFKKMIDDEEADEDEAVLNESILEMANATFRPSRRLRWHYRSRHSGLIAFSNRLVYDDQLIVFPSANESVARMGVEFRSVDGLYKAGTNPTEARTIVDAALEFMRKDPKRSLGIVTLNQKQRDLISEELEYAISRDRHAVEYIEHWKENKDGLEEFFVKNLENVQGDERDVIFIGTVYGPETRGGRVAQRFGPINGLAGKRRLNVLFSRAKEKIVTFSSMTAADIVAEEGGNAGAYMLKRWLEYCASGMLEGGTDTVREPDSDFEVYVIDQIRAMGCEPVPQVGVAGYFIDIGVKHPDWPHGFVLGVECDGASYHSAKSARDRDRLRQEVLEGLGWRFHRIWSTDWFNNPRREAERLRRVIAARMDELKAREAEFSQKPSQVEPASDSRSPEDQEMPTFVPERTPGSAPSDRITVPPAAPADERGVSIGDTVRVQYLSEDKKTLQITISKGKSDPARGVVHFETPIAKALLGAEEGDEVEVLVGSYVRRAVVENIVKHAD